MKRLQRGIITGVALIAFTLSVGCGKDARFHAREIPLTHENYAYYHRSPFTLVSNRARESTLDPAETTVAVIVKIDDKSLNELGAWPWNRAIYREFLAAVREVSPSPRAIYFDVLFEKDEVPPWLRIALRGDERTLSRVEAVCRYGDELLAKEMREGSNVFLRAPLAETTARYTNTNTAKAVDALTRTLLARSIPHTRERHKRFRAEYFAAEPMLLPYTSGLRGYAASPLTRDADDVVRRVDLLHALCVAKTCVFVPSLPLLLALDYFGLPRKRTADAVTHFALGDVLAIDTPHGGTLRIPIDREGCMRINYAGRETRTIPVDGEVRKVHAVEAVSFVDVLNREYSALERIRGKYLFVGAFSTRVATPMRSPYGLMFRVTHLANAFNTLVTKRFLPIVDKE